MFVVERLVRSGWDDVELTRPVGVSSVLLVGCELRQSSPAPPSPMGVYGMSMSMRRRRNRHCPAS